MAVGVCVFLVFSREWVRVLGTLVIGAVDKRRAGGPRIAMG